VQEALSRSPHDEARELIAQSAWRAQLVGAAAVVLSGADESTCAALWQALDGGSWVAPQLAAAAFLVDPAFEGRTEERLLGTIRRPPKLLGSLVRAYQRLPRPRAATLALLARHDRVLVTEEARIGVRGVDAWLDRLPMVCDTAVQQNWRRRPPSP
jgi:hypothetical protein